MRKRICLQFRGFGLTSMIDVFTVVLLLALVGLSFYAGYQYAVPKVAETLLTILHQDNIIRLVEREDGEVEVYSGYKFYNSKNDD